MKIRLQKGSQYGREYETKNKIVDYVFSFERRIMTSKLDKIERDEARELFRTFKEKHPRASVFVLELGGAE